MFGGKLPSSRANSTPLAIAAAADRAWLVSPLDANEMDSSIGSFDGSFGLNVEV